MIRVIADLHIHDWPEFNSGDWSDVAGIPAASRNVHLLNAVAKVVEPLDVESKQLILAGDVFHSRTSISHQSLAVFDAILRMAEQNGWSVSAVYGNHDCPRSGHSEHGALRPFVSRFGCSRFGYAHVDWAPSREQQMAGLASAVEELHRQGVVRDGLIVSHFFEEAAMGAGASSRLHQEVPGLADHFLVFGDVHRACFVPPYGARVQSIGPLIPTCRAETGDKFGYLQVQPKRSDDWRQGFEPPVHVTVPGPRFVTVQDEAVRAAGLPGAVAALRDALENTGRVAFVSVPTRFAAQMTDELRADPEVTLFDSASEVAESSAAASLAAEEAAAQADSSLDLESVIEAATSREIQDREEVIGTALDLVSRVQPEGFRRRQPVRLEWISVRSFMSLAGCDVVPLRSPGITRIEGVVAGGQGAFSSNGVGKSAFLDALAWCLFGETFRPMSAGAVVPRNGGGGCAAEVCVRVNGQEVNRRRGRIRSGLSVNGGSDACPSEILDRLLSCSFAEFRTSHCGQNGLASLATSTPAERVRLLESITPFDLLDRAALSATPFIDQAAEACFAARQEETAAQTRVQEAERLAAQAQAQSERAFADQLEVARRQRLEAEVAPHPSAEEVLSLRQAYTAAQAALAEAERAVRESARPCPSCGALGLGDEHLRQRAAEASAAVATAYSHYLRAEAEARSWEENVRARDRALSGIEAAYRSFSLRQAEAQAAATGELADALSRAQRKARALHRKYQILQNAKALLSSTSLRSILAQRALVPVIDEANRALRVLADGEYQLASRINSVGSRLNIGILALRPDGTEEDIAAAAGGVRSRIEFALFVGLAMAYPSSNVLIIDEALDGLDAAGVARAETIIRQLATVRHVLLVTHRDVIREMFSDRVLLVERGPAGTASAHLLVEN